MFSFIEREYKYDTTAEESRFISVDKKEFLKEMKKHRVSDFMYNLDGKGRTDERFCMVKDGELWNVFYSERGCKTTDKFFESESQALEYMCQELCD